MPRLRLPIAAVLAVAALAAIPAQPVGADTAPTGVASVLQDDAVFLHSNPDDIKAAVTQAHDLGFDRVRITAGWSVIAPQPDAATKPEFDATDPAAYPADAWMNLDRAVRLVTEGGLKPMIDIAFWAPRWATKDPADQTGRMRTEIDPAAYAQFAQAVARRYAGGYAPPAKPQKPQPQQGNSPDSNWMTKLFGKPQSTQAQPQPAPAEQPKPLPAVDLFTIWNEPNHVGFVMPQWVKVDGQWTPHSPTIYRAMVRAAYPAIKAGAPNSRILIGGTASMGSSTPGKSGVPPLKFLKALACVDDNYQPITTGDCADYTELPGDGWAHHPYSLRTLPDAEPNDADKLPVNSTPRLVAALAKLTAMHRLAPANHDVYMTEYGYETNPPDPQAMFSPGEQGRLLAWAEYLGTRDPAVKMWPQFLLRDRPGDPAGPQNRPFGDWQTGLFYADGSPKPAVATWRAPAFAQCVVSGGRRMAMVWGRLRDPQHAATAVVEMAPATGETWRAQPTASTPQAGAARARTASVAMPGAGVARYVPFRRGARYRVRWGGAATADSPTVTPVGCSTPVARTAKAAKAAKAAKSKAPHSSVPRSRAARGRKPAK